MKYEEISKLDAAKRQLIVAIRMLFERRDPISVHTLAAASQGILIDLARIKGIKSLLVDAEMIRPEKRIEVNSKVREAQNYFKHADRDAESQFKYYPEITPLYLFDACRLYEQITDDRFPEAIGFCTWFYMKYPQLLIEGEIKNKLNELMEGIDINDYELVLYSIDHINQQSDTE